MTRFASIMGVAAVATLVLLSGCEYPDENGLRQEPGGNLGSDHDCATMSRIRHPRRLPISIPVSDYGTEVEATISRTDTNKGSVSLTIT